MNTPILNPSALCLELIHLRVLYSRSNGRRKPHNAVYQNHLTILIVCRKRRGVSSTVLD